MVRVKPGTYSLWTFDEATSQAKCQCLQQWSVAIDDADQCSVAIPLAVSNLVTANQQIFSATVMKNWLKLPSQAAKYVAQFS